MRIIDEIPHPRMKISIFKMNEKLSIKFEKNLIEQIFKFRDGSALNNIEKLKQAFNNEAIKSIELSIDQELNLKSILESKMMDDELPEFEEII